MLAIARGLMNSPKMLLLDEPSLGLSPLLTREVAAIIKRISEEGMTILLIEQNASLALRLANQCYVLETGSMVLEGQSKDLQSNPHIKSAYLGIDPGNGKSVVSIRRKLRPFRIAARQKEGNHLRRTGKDVLEIQ